MIEHNKETSKMISQEPSPILSPRERVIEATNPAERFLEMFVSIMPKMAEAFQNSPTTQIVTLRVFIDEYMYLIKNNCSASYAESVQLSFNHLTGFFDIQRTLCSIQQKDVENFLVYLQQKVKKGYVVYFRNLKAAFSKAREWKYVSENFFTKVKLPKKQKLAPAFINSDQLSVICDRIKNKIVKDVVVFAFYSGMRLDEIVNLKWRNIDLGNRIITVGDENFITKGRNQRIIPICEETYEVLSRQKTQYSRVTPSFILPLGNGENISVFVFCKNNGERYTDDYYSKEFKSACKAASMDESIHFHSLRHSFASNLAQKGVSLYTIKELLGHSSISTTEIYSHLNVESLREAVKKLDETPSCVLPPAKTAGQALSRGEKSVVKIFKINSVEK